MSMNIKIPIKAIIVPIFSFVVIISLLNKLPSIFVISGVKAIVIEAIIPVVLLIPVNWIIKEAGAIRNIIRILVGLLSSETNRVDIARYTFLSSR